MVGILIGFFAMNAEVYISTTSPSDKTEEKSATEEGTSNEVVKSFEAISSSSQISFSHEAIVVDELPEISEVEETETDGKRFFPPVSKALKILFRRIISPNAP